MSKYYIVSTTFLVTFITSLIVDGAFEVPLYWYVALIVLFLLVSAAGSVILSLEYFVPVITRGNSGGVALSFDDGPAAGHTDKVLDILRRFNAPATFFCIGKRIIENELVAKRIHEEGHVIGNHSFFHRATFDLQSSTMIMKELYDTDMAIQKIVGKRPRFFRPPYGVTNPMVAKAVRIRNYKVVGWSIRSFDTVSKDSKKLLARVVGPLKDGDIILFHDHCNITLEILPLVLQHIAKSGLKVVRIDQLTDERPYA